MTTPTLPKFNSPVYNETLPDSKQEITMRPYLIGEEKLFLEVVNSKSNDITKFKKIVNRFVDVDVDELSMVDMFYIIAKIRAMSKGEEVELTVTCEKCNKKFEARFDFIESMKIINENVKSKAIKLSDKLTIEVMPIKFIDSISESTADYICSITKRVIFDDKVYDNFTKKELETQIVSGLNSDHVKKIIEGYKQLISIQVIVKTNCPYCKESMSKEVENIFDFFI